MKRKKELRTRAITPDMLTGKPSKRKKQILETSGLNIKKPLIIKKEFDKDKYQSLNSKKDV